MSDRASQQSTVLRSLHMLLTDIAEAKFYTVRTLPYVIEGIGAWIVMVALLFSGLESIRMLSARTRRKLRLPMPFIFHTFQLVLPIVSVASALIIRFVALFQSDQI